MSKERRKEDRAFSTTEVGTLLESLRSEFKVFGEGLTSLLEWKDRVDSRLDRIEGRLTAVEDRLSAVEYRLGLVEGRLTSVEGRLGRVEDAVLSTSSRVSRLETKVGI